MQKIIENKFIRLLSFTRHSKTLISFLLIPFFIFDLSKAETNISAANKKTKISIDNLNSQSALENLNLDSVTKINTTNINQIGVDYIKSKKDLEDYIIDTGDALFIQFENVPRGLNSLNEENQSELDPNNLSYLEPKNDLSNYILDEGDVININFKNIPKGDPELLIKPNNNKSLVTEYLEPVGDLQNYLLDEGDSIFINFENTPELNRTVKLDKLGEVFLPRIKDTYVRGLTIYQLKKILEERYEEFLIDPEIEVRIVKYRFINSGDYTINQLEKFLFREPKIYM